MAENEKWKEIPGFPDYSVSNFGQVMSFKQPKPRIMKSRVTRNGYHYVDLLNGHKKRYLVARLVAKAFVANFGDKPHVNHLDSNRANNRATNLEWCTRKENMQHALKKGRLKTPNLKGAEHPMSKLSEQDVMDIRRRLSEGEKSSDICADYPVTYRHIRYIANKTLWSCLP